MLLKSLRTIPDDLFDEVIFKRGGNLIFGYKDPELNPKDSLNGIGKSTFLDLIDFCLLSSYSKTNSNRIFLAEKLLTKHDIVLSFDSDGKNFEIKRSIDDPGVVLFSEDDKEQEMTLKEAQKRMSQICFMRKNYKGKFHDEWYRRLMLLFLKIHKAKKQDKFTDPITYIDNSSLYELLQFHFYLLGIDNTLSSKNFAIQVDKKKKVPALREVKALVEETYGVSDIDDANTQMLDLQSEISRLERTLEDFKLSENYKASEKDIDELTRSIKNLLLKNMGDHKRLADLRKALENEQSTFTKSDATKVAKMYSELNENFSQKVKVSLDTVIDFRKELANSRKEFIGAELEKLRSNVRDREAEINKLDEKRAEILGFLKAKKAISDLTGAYSTLSEKKQDLTDLRSKLHTYNTLEKEKSEIEAEEKKNDSDIVTFTEAIKSGELVRLYDTFMYVYEMIYGKPQGKKPVFNINHKLTTDAKMEIDVTLPADNSKANNQGRTLVYDLMLMVNMVENKLNGPRFLAHDGIFDGMDKAHFVSLHKFLSEDPLAEKFQYIYTLNQEGDLNQLFGAEDDVNVEQLKNEAILVLTAKDKLLGDFDK